MAWSTRELAELAGTTVNTVRHYHRLGLMAEPDRRYNGYKQYTAADLVRLLRIRRLVDLGVPLSRVPDLIDGGTAGERELDDLDAELQAGIERLQRARADLAAIRHGHAPASGPSGFEPYAETLSDADSSLIHVFGRLYDDEAMADVRKMVGEDTSPPEVRAEIDALAADAGDETVLRLARALAPSIEQSLRDYPWLSDPGDHLPRGERVSQETFVEALQELYNPAQIRVLALASHLATEQIAAAQASAPDETAPGA